MSQVRTRKRPALGTSPFETTPIQLSTTQNNTSVKQNSAFRPMATNQYLQWAEQNHPTYPDPRSSYGSAPYNGTTQSQQIPRSSSGQVARRSAGQQMVSRANYNDGNNEAWAVLADSVGQPTDSNLLNQDDDLDQRAELAKRETQAKRKQIPPFVQKLSSFLEENRNTDLIRWSDKGDSFIVVDEDEFARTLIPELFKHKNYASFVRQLNMYGFHKKVGLSDNSMRASERKDKSPSEYYHPYFQRGRSNLLWLIQKPKNPQGKGSGKGAKSRQEDGTLDDEGEEVYDVDSPAPGPRGHQNSTPQRNGRQPLMIGQGYGENSDGMTPSQDQMAAIHQELASVRKNQKMISEVLQQMARENERQAQAYKTLHDRHESSINAILTFLATVYNRSLAEGQAAPNFGSVLAGAFPQNTEAQGNVVDMGDYNEQNSTPTQAQPLFKRQPLLLKAPPTGDQSTASTTTAHPSSRLSPNTAQQNLFSTSSTQSPAVQELFSPVASNRSSQSPRMPPSNSAASPDQLPEADIMSMINSHNAQNSFTPGTRMNFPEALSHLQNADGKTPLTPNQRNNVLQLMAGSSADNGTNNNNAMTSPNPPTIPETSQFDVTRDQLTFLGNAIKDQEQKVENLQQSLAPLSPSGSIPGIGADGQYNTDLLDIDSIFNSGDYFTEHAPEIDFANGGDIPDFDFSTGLPEDAGDTNDDATMRNDVGLDGVRDGRSERGSEIETLGSSEAPSPAVTVEDVPEEAEEVGRKRRRKN